jgi:hypothetical protein
MTVEDGSEIATKTFTGNNFSNLADQTVQCEGSVQGWHDGFFEITVAANYNINMGDIRVSITNTLDQGATDESIGYGDMDFEYEFDDGRNAFAIATTSPGNYDLGVENPSELWENNCGATEKDCAGKRYFGGANECAQGTEIFRTFQRSRMHEATNKAVFRGTIWTIDSWDGETFTVRFTDQDGNILSEQSWTGNNFANLADQTV